MANNYTISIGATINKQSYIKMVNDLTKFGKTINIPINIETQALGKALSSFTNVINASGEITKNVQSYNVGLGKSVQITSQLNKETKELEVVSTKMSVNQEKIQKEQQRIQKAISSNLSSIQKHYNSQQQSIEKTIASRQKELEIMKQSALVRLNKGEATNEKQLKYEQGIRLKLEQDFRKQISDNLSSVQKYYSTQQQLISKNITSKQKELELMKLQAITRLNKGEAPNEKQLKYESNIRYKLEKQFREQIASNLTATQKYYSTQQAGISKNISLRQQELEKLKQEIKIKRDLDSWKSSKLSSIDKMKIGSETIFNNTKVKSELDSLVKSINSVGTIGGRSVKQVNAEMAKFQTTIKQVGFDTKQLNKETHSYFGNLKMIMGKFMDWLVVGTIFMQSINQIRQMIVFTNELNKAQTNIAMITGRSREEINGMTQDYIGLASALHDTTSSVMKASEEFLRAGHNQEETMELIKTSTLMSKIAGQDQKETADQLIAITNGYKMNINETMGVVDKLTTVDNASATSTKELGTALERTSSSAQMAGVNFERLVSWVECSPAA